jgi:hypothetical protein
MESTATSSQIRLVEYDPLHRRLWIRGQRLHHGATGSIVALSACLGLIAGPGAKAQAPPRSLTMLAIAGGALMAHDWKDRAIWFKPGYGTQP